MNVSYSSGLPEIAKDNVSQIQSCSSVPTWYLQSQHEELKKQHADLEEDHRKQGEEFSRTFNDHKERYLQLQQEKEQEISKLKGICKIY